MTAELRELAIATAQSFGLDPVIVQCICKQESDWQPDAQRYEPAFFKRYISSMKNLGEEEMRLRATSMGLMQVMGQVAREQGFDDPLTDLFQPVPNLIQGCTKFKKCVLRANGEIRQALLYYNGGGATEYPDLVLRHKSLYGG